MLVPFLFDKATLYSMRIANIVLDVRGIGHDSKKNFIRENVNNRKLNFIGIQETNKNDFSKTELHNLCGGRNFEWSLSQPRGKSRGILVVINCDNFEISSVEIGIYFMRILLYDKKTNFNGI